MDFQRYILIGAIVAIAYTMLLQWDEFSQRQKDTPSPITAEQIVPQLVHDESRIPVAESSDGVEDVPVIVAPASTPAEQDLPQNIEDIIKVSTDTLKLEISLKGGDIVSLQLPQHYKSLDTPEIPFTILQNGQRTYIAQSGLVGANGTDTAKGRPTFRSKSDSYILADDQQELIVDLVLTEENGVRITKRFILRRGDYLLDIEYIVDNLSADPWQALLYGQIKRDGGPDPAGEGGAAMGVQPFLGMATTTEKDRFLKMDFEDMTDEPFKSSVQGGWIAMLQHYFLSAWIPDQSRLQNYSTTVTSQGFYILRFTSPTVTVDSGQQGSLKAQFYAGPKDQYRLEEISEGLELTVDYGWLWMIAQPLYWVMTKFFNLSGNWGVAIILLTVLVKAIFFWPSAMAYKSMAKMRQVQPKMLDIKERFPEDKQAQSQAMMELYKKEGVNPLGGCLPIFIQMPVFIALYWTLLESVELRHAPFFGYIQDLSVKDPYFILPLVMGASMFFQQRLNPAPPDPMQAKVMQWMPVMFTFFFLFFPAGLVLYWVVNNILSIIQQWIISKQVEAAAAAKQA